MNESTEHGEQDSTAKTHEATRVLADLAAEVEQERAERGRSALDPVVLPDGEALADTINEANRRREETDAG